MSRTGQVVHVRGSVGGGSGARASGDNGSEITPGASWTVDYLNEWDDAERLAFDGTDEMVVSSDGIYLIMAGTAYYADGYQTSGYIEVALKRNATVVGSYASSFQNDVSMGYNQMRSLLWVGECAAGDRFSLVATNNSNANYYIGYYWRMNFIYATFIAP